MNFPPLLQQLLVTLRRLPGVGPKTAQRMAFHLLERDRSSLFQIDKALGKIHDGTYGQCECCADMININRLRARPFAALCISCMEEQEEFHTPVN